MSALSNELRGLCWLWSEYIEDDIDYKTAGDGTVNVTLPGVQVAHPFTLSFPGSDEMTVCGVILGVATWLLQQYGFNYELAGTPTGVTCTVSVGENEGYDVIAVEGGSSAAAAALRGYLSARWMTQLHSFGDPHG